MISKIVTVRLYLESIIDVHSCLKSMVLQSSFCVGFWVPGYSHGFDAVHVSGNKAFRKK